jgi:hypothetical protein
MSFDFGGSFSEATDVASEVETNPEVYDYGDEQITNNLDNPGESVNNFSGNADFVNATNPGSIDTGPAVTEGYGVNEVGATPLNPGATEIEGYGVNEVGASPPPSTLETLQAKAGDALNSVQDAIKKQLAEITPAKINQVATGVAKNFVQQVATQVIATQLPPALQPYATRSLGNALSTTSAASVNSSTNPQSPTFVGPPAPSTVNSKVDPTTLEGYGVNEVGATSNTTNSKVDPTTLEGYGVNEVGATSNTTDNSASNVGYVTGQDPENGTYYVKNEKTGQIVASGLTEQAATLKAQDQTFIDSGDVPANTNPGSNAVNYTAPGTASDPQLTARSLATAASQVVSANSPGTVNDPSLATVPLSTIAGAVINTAANTALADTAGRVQGLIRQAQNQQTARVQNQNKAQATDWRVRLSLAPNSNYLYNAPDCGPVLWPLYNTNGVIFPYTPSIDTAYKANYTQYDLTHSNYRGYFYQNSYVDGINIKATFTAQDTSEANYLLAVIHFFRSVTKMFYGQDAQAGSPPPLVFLSGLGDFQFNQHPCVVSQFNYNMPADVNYIRAQNVANNGTNQLSARNRQTTLGNPVSNAIQRLASLGQGIRPGALTAPFAPQGSLANNNPTYVPTKMDINLTLLPIQSRQQVSQQFSLAGFANGNLLKGGFW